MNVRRARPGRFRSWIESECTPKARPGLIRVVLAGGLLWLMIVLGGTLDDVITRDETPHPRGCRSQLGVLRSDAPVAGDHADHSQRMRRNRR